MFHHMINESGKLAIALIVLSLSACDVGSGVEETGPNTYTVEERVSPVMGGMAKARDEAMQESVDYCQHIYGQYSVVSSTPLSAAGPGEPMGYAVTFACVVPAGAPAPPPSSNINLPQEPEAEPDMPPSTSFKTQNGAEIP